MGQDKPAESGPLTPLAGRIVTARANTPWEHPDYDPSQPAVTWGQAWPESCLEFRELRHTKAAAGRNARGTAGRGCTRMNCHPATCEPECSALLNLTAPKLWGRMRTLRSVSMKLSRSVAAMPLLSAHPDREQARGRPGGRGTPGPCGCLTEARRVARELLGEVPGLGQDTVIEVADEAGQVVQTVSLSDATHPRH